MTLKTDYLKFLEENFKGLNMKMPLFYNWNYALRFDLQKEFTNPVSTDDEEYFDEVYKRAKTLFESCFSDNDQIYLSVFKYKWKNQKLKKSNRIFKLIKNKSDLIFKFDKTKYRYEEKESWNRVIIKTSVKNIDSEDLIIGLCNTDFPMMKPSIPEEVYIINIDKKLIFHIYDDRGLDILSADKNFLVKLYSKYDNWILEFDRERIKENLSI